MAEAYEVKDKIVEALFPGKAAEFKKDFSKENAKALRFLLIAGLVVLVLSIGAIYLLHMNIRTSPRLIEFFLFFLVSFALYIGYRRDILSSATFVLFLWISLLLAWSILLTAGDHSDNPSYVFILLILILPLFIRAVFGKVLILILSFSAAFLIMDVLMRPREVVVIDVIHLVVAVSAACFLSYRQLTERIHMMQKSTDAEAEAERDGLTGIYNRRGGEQMIRAYVENGMPGAFLLIDVDDFKYINDNYGHAAGDEALKAVANCLKNCFRDTDVVMRMGGDEFIVYAVGMADARHVEEKLAYLKGKLHKIYLDETERDHVTASIGCVINLGSYPGYEEISAAADKLLYHVKVAGKDNYMSSDADYRPETKAD